VDVAILGTADRDAVIYSHTAQAGDDIIFAMDLDGFFPEKLGFAWDTTMKKGPDIVRKQMLIMNEIGKLRLAHAGKDMSNPGSIGTLGMLLETSGKGGYVDVSRIPIPEGVDFVQWVKAYQGYGFVLTALPSHSSKIIELFGSVGATGAVVGKVDGSKILSLKEGKNVKVLFDFNKEIITGCDPAMVPGQSACKSSG
jgi:selenophosphate synthetase-related protein